MSERKFKNKPPKKEEQTVAGIPTTQAPRVPYNNLDLDKLINQAEKVIKEEKTKQEICECWGDFHK